MVNPRTRDILMTIGVVGFVALAIVLPGLPKVLAPFLQKQQKLWGHFNKRRLKRELKRLEKDGVIEQVEENNQQVFRLTQKGKAKVFKYKIEEISLDNKWDGKWRLVAYDIPALKKKQAENFRYTLSKMRFLRLQKSLWLIPYKCEDEIEFLKALYGLKDEVLVLVVSKIEGEMAYKSYFGVGK